MAAVVQLQHQQHHTKALTKPTWFLVNLTPPPAPREGAKKQAAYSPLLLSPAVWQKAQQDEKKRNTDDDDAERSGLPASPRISCMGQVKGRRKKSRGCSSARGPPPAPRGSRYCSAGAGAGGTVANLVLGLFGMRRRNARATSRACAKVRDVPRACGTASASAPGSARGVRVRGRRCAAVVEVGVFDPPLPVVVRRPAAGGSAPSLWERRRCGGRALEGLRLMT